MNKIIIALLSVTWVNCGGSSTPEPKIVEEAELEESFEINDDLSTARRSKSPLEEEDLDDGLEVEGIRGRLHPADIANAFQPRQQAIVACFEETWRSNPYAGGSIEMNFHVARDGYVKKVFIEKSDLGSWSVERCILGEARAMKFVKPSGGEAFFKLPVDFPAQKQSNWLATPVAQEELDTQFPLLVDCPNKPSKTKMTMYIGKDGNVNDVGFASAHSIADAWANCASTVINSWVFTIPNSTMVKTTLMFPQE